MTPSNAVATSLLRLVIVVPIGAIGIVVALILTFMGGGGAVIFPAAFAAYSALAWCLWPMVRAERSTAGAAVLVWIAIGINPFSLHPSNEKLHPIKLWGAASFVFLLPLLSRRSLGNRTESERMESDTS